MSHHLVWWTLNRVDLGVLVVDEDVNVKRLHVNKGLRTVIASQRLAASFLENKIKHKILGNVQRRIKKIILELHITV